MPFRKTILLAALTLLLLECPTRSFARTADALIDKLVQKGILTSQEAEELRNEPDSEPPKSAMSSIFQNDWTEDLKFTGDFRMRYDNTSSENTAYVERQRYRYRIRFGVVLTLEDDFEFGLRLSSGPDANPLSSNQTFENNASKKEIFIDRAYGKWSTHIDDDVAFIFTVGKMENPFVFSDMIFDGDYAPEGFAEQITWKFSKKHSARLILGQFILDELAFSTADPFLFGAQLRFDSVWSEQFTSTMGIAGLWINNTSGLTTSNVFDVNNGNLRDPGGNLVHGFNPLAADATVTYSAPSMMGYPGRFPISLYGEFLWNPAASENNIAWMTGVSFGKAARKRTWEISYRWKSIDPDAWYEEVISDDFGGFYQSASNRGAAGLRSGTNVRGHTVRAGYAVTDFFVVSLTYFRSELMESQPAGSVSAMNRVFLDALLKF